MRVKLDKVCKRIYAGGDVPKDRYSTVKTAEYAIPIYANAEKDNGLYGYTDTARENELSITVAARGTIGFTAIRREPFLSVVRLITVVPDLSTVSERYLYYALRNCKPASSGTSIPQLTVPDIKKNEIELYSLSAQETIADKLDAVGRVIELRQQQLQTLDELVKFRFVEMFGDMASPECKWDTTRLVNACACPDDIKCGPFGTQLSKDEYKDSGIAVWEIPQINDAFQTNPTHFITEAKATQLSEYSLIPGDIAMSRKGNVGKCAIFPDGYQNGIIHSDVLRIRVDKENVNPIFLMCQLHFSRAVTHQIELVSSGAIMAGVNVTKLKQIYVHIPPKEVQDQFADFVKRINKAKAVVQEALDEAQLLFDSLMQQYFS